MSIAHYLRRLLRLWWVIALTTTLGVGIAAIVYQAQTPKYVAVSQMTIGYQGSTIGDEFDAHNLSVYRAAALADLASRAPVIRRAMATAGVTGPLPQVVAGSYGSSSLLTIVVVDSDPVRAAKVANGFATVLPVELVRLVGPLDRGMTVHMTAYAVPPGAPFSPVLKHVLGLGLLLGLVLGVLAVAALEILDRTIRDSDQLIRATGRPLLGVVPRGLRAHLLPLRTHPTSARARGYRNLRTTVMALDARVIAVTSPLAREGRTTLVANLAVALHATGVRVLAIDADLRRPRMAQAFGIADEVGLAQALAGRITVRDAVQDLGVGLPCVLVAGAADRVDSDLFVGLKFQDLIAQVREDFDLVLIDAPNAEHNAAAGIVCGAADATVVVARIGRSTPKVLGSSLALLRTNGASLVGVVANGSHGGSAADAGLKPRSAMARFLRTPWLARRG